MAFLYILAIVGSFVLCLFIPNIFWSVTIQDLFIIIQDKNPDAQFANQITDIAERLGITTTNLYDWAMHKIILTFVCAIILSILLVIIIRLASKNKKNK